MPSCFFRRQMAGSCLCVLAAMTEGQYNAIKQEATVGPPLKKTISHMGASGESHMGAMGDAGLVRRRWQVRS